MRRVLFATYHFPPSTAVGAQRAERLVRLLPEFGYQVDVVCALTEGPPGESWQEQREGGQGVVTRIHTPFPFGRDPSRPPSPRAFWDSLFWKLRAYTEWVFLTREWSWNWAVSACSVVKSRIREKTYDLMVIDAPPNPSAVPFLRLARQEGVPVVIDFRDIWSTSEGTMGPLAWIHPERRRQAWERRMRSEVLESADHMIVTTMPAISFFENQCSSLLPGKISYVPNAFRQVDSAPEPAAVRRGDAPLRIAYTGSLAYGRDEQLKSFIRGMRVLGQQDGTAVELEVVGDDGGDIHRFAAGESLGAQVLVHPWSAQREAARVQRNADGLLLLQPSVAIGTRLAVPAKLFEYMGRRRHVFGLVGSGPAADIIRHHDLGVVASGEEPEQVAAALRILHERVRERPFLPPPPEEFSERNTVARFAKVLDLVMDRRAQDGSD